MYTSDWANIARCANDRMDALWNEACHASFYNLKWEPIHQRRWREWETYMAIQSLSRRAWHLRDQANGKSA